MDEIGYFFAALTMDAFPDQLDEQSWVTYQRAAKWLAFASIFCCGLAFLVYYFVLRSTSFSKGIIWFSVGTFFALFSGIVGYYMIYNLGITKQELVLNPKPDYDAFLYISIQIGFMSFISCLVLYVALSCVRQLRGRNHPDVPFTFRRNK